MELSKLNNAFFVKVYEDSQRVYVWFGGLGVSIYDLELNEIDYFTLAEYPSIDKIKQSIEINNLRYKPIIIGKKGETIKKIRESSQKEIESIFNIRVHLYLDVVYLNAK